MARPFTTFDRSVAAGRLASEPFDVLVVGGGITGAGVLLEAAARGLRAALVEQDDFASGTSSKSSKLVHGGLRYLQQRELRLVHENLVERQRLLHNAPHLVRTLPFLIPLFGSGGVVDRTVVRGYSVALWLYDAAGGWRIGHRHKKVTAAEVSAHLPTLRTDRIVAGFLYFDASTDDARLTLSIVRTAVLDHGATALNHAGAVSFLCTTGGTITGARVRVDDLPGAGEIDVRARVVVNAGGVWADDIRSLEDGRHPGSLRPAKGIHLTVPASKLPCDVAAVVPVRSDRRSIFVVPWGEHTYLGTTDTDYSGALARPSVERADIDYVLAAVNAVISVPIRPSDVTGAWAGLRPLLATPPEGRRLSTRTADLSRRHKVMISGGGLVTVTGGKLTTYRKMAEDTLGHVVRRLGDVPGRCPTRRMRLRGAEGLSELRRPGTGTRYGLSEGQFAHLVERYGGEAPLVAGLAEGRPELLEPLAEGLGYLLVEALYAARYEMASTLEDVLARRTRALLLDARAAAAAAATVGGLLAPELGWDARRLEAEVAELRAASAAELSAASSTEGEP
ncbi:MAG: glycerol-3-phosphate dehydrogenase/oxidase [Acidimicrobiales bacterium]